MAEKKTKSQAEKAASAANTKKSTGSNTKKKTAEKPAPASEPKFPTRFVTATIFALLFILFLIIFLQPEGFLLEILNKVILGLIGKIGFTFAIPGFLYLFIIHAASGKRPVIMRSVCVGVFVLLCGAFSHLILDPKNLPGGFALIGSLYMGGISGTTGGVICGGIGMIVRFLFGPILCYIVLIIAAVLTLLASMQITVPSIIRAVRNRPKADWEEEESDAEEVDPAAMVVNHIAKKRIAHIEQQRQTQFSAPADPEAFDIPVGGEQRRRRATQQQKQAEPQVSAYIEDPQPVSPVPEPTEEPQEDFPLPSPSTAPSDPIPQQMPVFSSEDPLPAAPNTEAPPKLTRNSKVTAKDAAESADEVAEEIAQSEAKEKPIYCFPPLDLLRTPKKSALDGTAEMRENSRRLNESLASFKIEAHIINVTRGPSVTRYEVELEKGVRLNKLTAAADDIALSLGASGVRIAPVPGKISVVGIEVPNRAVTTVSLREVIDSSEFAQAESKSTFAIGKDISGNCIVGNIAKLPHMLIAGTTGSGKSVCINSIIISLLYKASPEDVRLIMVDPKMVELGIYNGIPHLLIPVVTDPKKAAGSLQWAVTEMMRRYRSMSDAGVRDLESYNSIIDSQEVEGEKLPQIVVIIDELADLMLVAAKEVEESICRIAQMGRAAGIHLLIATQRPSADVITGLMKANIPSRIAFSVASAMESRIILDTQGAEKLVGKGDMLYAPIGMGKPTRVQGCFVSDAEVEAVTAYVKDRFNTTYDQQVLEEIERKAAQTGSGKATASDAEPSAEELTGDEMLPAAVDVILETGQASVSMLQRRLKLGYARAARIVDEMEEKGIVGPFQGSKPRAILITKEQWAAMRCGQSGQMDFDDLAANANEGVPEDID